MDADRPHAEVPQMFVLSPDEAALFAVMLGVTCGRAGTPLYRRLHAFLGAREAAGYGAALDAGLVYLNDWEPYSLDELAAAMGITL